MQAKIKLISLRDIIVKDRFRKDLGDILELARLIRSGQGLQYNYIIVEQIGEEYHLRAGGRRYEAYKRLYNGDPECWDGVVPTEEQRLVFEFIPCDVKEGLTQEDRLRIEYLENKGRKDFEWQEEANLVSAFHTLMLEKYGQSRRGPGKSGWSVRDTAEELGLAPATVVNLLSLAEGLEDIPSIRDIKRKHKALSHLKRKRREEIVKILDLPDFDKDSIKVINADSEKYLETLESESIDIVITDPPWGIDLEERIHESRKELHPVYDDKFDAWKTTKILMECFRLQKPNTPIYMFYSAFPDKVIEGRNILLAAGYNVEALPLIWNKKHVLSHDAAEIRHMLCYEVLFYGWKGDRPLLEEPCRNVIEYQVSFQNRIHSSEKPIGLLEFLLNLHVEKGATVLDPFAGSCNIADACKNLGLRCYAIEIQSELTKAATLRLWGF